MPPPRPPRSSAGSAGAVGRRAGLAGAGGWALLLAGAGAPPQAEAEAEAGRVRPPARGAGTPGPSRPPPAAKAPAPALGDVAAAAGPGAPVVFVAGSTGATGRLVVTQLRDQGYRVIAGYRKPKRLEAAGIAGLEGVSYVVNDVTAPAAAQAEALAGADAVVCATGFSGLSPTAPAAVDGDGTIKLVEAAKLAGVKKFVLVTSLLTNARAVGEEKNSNFVLLNAFGGILDQKRRAELYLASSGLDYTIVRPGGLTDAESEGNLRLGAEDTTFEGRVARAQVAQVAVAAVGAAGAANRIVEVTASPEFPPAAALFP